MYKYSVLVRILAVVPALLPSCSRAPFSGDGEADEGSARLEVSVGGPGAKLSEESSVARDSGASPSEAKPSGPVPSGAVAGDAFDIHSLCAGRSLDDECILPSLGSRGSAGRCKLPTASGSSDGGRLLCFARRDLPCEGKNAGDDCARATPAPRQVAGRCVAVPSHGVGNDGNLLCLSQDDLVCNGKTIGDECELPKGTRYSFRGQREYKGHCRAVPSGRRGDDTILLCSPRFR